MHNIFRVLFYQKWDTRRLTVDCYGIYRRTIFEENETTIRKDRIRRRLSTIEKIVDIVVHSGEAM